jgi:hypothetical protein
MAFEGATMMEVAGKGGAHIKSTTDDAHQAMRDQMAHAPKEDQAKWFAEFQKQWDAKPNA